MLPAYLSPWFNHLWQSTLVVAVAGMLTLLLRKNRAQARYWLWLTSSVKFLIPFSLLVAIGGHVGWSSAPAVTQARISVVEEISHPFTAPAVLGSTSSAIIAREASLISVVLLAVWACGFLAVVFCWWRRWRGVLNAARTAKPLLLGTRIKVLSSPALLEPGVFGVFRPMLLLPEGITDCLEPRQLEAILAHELCHVRRHDNLGAAIQMAVEAIFWFYPLAWWIGARLVEERERACDEEVLRLGNEPQVYAESILKTCQFYLESPLICASGISGADLKQRIVRIMTQDVVQRLDVGRKLLLAAIGTAAVAGPLVFGMMNAPQNQAQSPEPAGPRPTFEVASIKPNNSGGRDISVRISHGRFTANNISLQQLIEEAYDIQGFQISDGPNWLASARYDIAAKADDSPNNDPSGLSESERKMFQEQQRLRLQSLLATRFHLRSHIATREGSVYALVIAKNGPKLQRAPSGTPSANRGMKMRPGQLDAQGVQISFLAQSLSRELGRTVMDKTGLTGIYDFTLEWTPDERQTQMFRSPGDSKEGGDSAPALDASGPSVFTAIQEQLGLRLESQKGSIEILAIDHVEKMPSEN